MPFSTDQLIAIALSHHRAGRLADAEGIYRKILTSGKTHAVALDYFGVLAIQTSRLDLAANLLRKSITADPSQPNSHCNLGQCLRQLGRYDEAIECFREAIRLQPDLAVAHSNLGTVYSETVQLEEAVGAYRKAIELQPDYAAAHMNLANALKDLGLLDEALLAARIAINLQPDVAESHNTLGAILADAGKFAEAIDAYRKAIELNPHYAEAHSNLGNALAGDSRHDEAETASIRAVELDPRNVQSHWNLAVILLRNGDYTRGWPEYEWRWTTQKHFPRPSPRFYPPRFPTPHWTGGDIAGQTMFLHAEQGFGDTLHFCRYAPMVAARGARVIVEVHPELRRLLTSLQGVAQAIERGDTVPPFELHCPMMSLPFAFGTNVDSIPGNVPYLAADPENVREWKSRLASTDVGRALPAIASLGGQCPPYTKRSLRVGLCWAGSPDHANDRDRSISLSQLAPLASSSVTFHSLQKGPAQEQIAEAPCGLNVIDYSNNLTDFADTAALIANLDLVITVDTAIAHLAGAMGKPVWVLIRKLPDWRWFAAGDDTPWYPTMRLFRQTRCGEWDEVIARLAKSISELEKKTTGRASE